MDLQQLLLGGGGIALLLALIQVSPLKVNPWAPLGKLLLKGLRAKGKAFNHDLLEIIQAQGEVDTEIKKELEELKKALEAYTHDSEEDRIISCRCRILDFGDALRRHDRHSEEAFHQVLDDITKYEQYCDTHPNFKNNRTVATVTYIQDIYRQCMEEDSFL